MKPSESAPSASVLSYKASNTCRGSTHVGVLPEPQHRPPAGPQQGVRVPVPTYVGFDLRPPPRSIRLRPGRMLRAAVPKASVHENSHLVGDERQIGASTCPWDDPINAETESHPMNGRPKSQFTGRVAATHYPHSVARFRTRGFRSRRLGAVRPFRHRHHQPTRTQLHCAERMPFRSRRETHGNSGHPSAALS
jgi:hypothetical protein